MWEWLFLAMILSSVSSYIRNGKQYRLFSLRAASTAVELAEVSSLFRNKRVLTVGDGSLAFSAALSRSGVCSSVTASTWDSPESLLGSYADAQTNVNLITEKAGNSVVYGVDATKLNSSLGSFDIVVWNFPHVPGKANNKHNRALIDGFLDASKNVLSDEAGSVVLSLCPDQSGWHASTHREYLQSWKLPHYAAGRGYVCSKVIPFESLHSFCGDTYFPVGHRGSGGRFSAYQGKADTFLLSPSGLSGCIGLQAPLYSHELHLNAPSITDIEWLEMHVRRAVSKICNNYERSELDEGAVWSCQVVDVYVCPRTGQVSHAVEVAYCSTTYAVGRELADCIRVRVEKEVVGCLNAAREGGAEEYFSMRREKVGGRVSQPHFWRVAERKKELEDARHDSLNEALQVVQQAGHTRETLELLSEDNLSKTRSSGGGDADIELIRGLARCLWKRRLGVLIREVGKSGADHREDEDKAVNETENCGDGADSTEDAAAWSLYLLYHSLNGRTYIGVTTDMERRLLQHNGMLAGGAKYTRAFLGAGAGTVNPWRVALSIPRLSKGRAMSLEAKAKAKSKSLSSSSLLTRAVRRARLILDLTDSEERREARVRIDLGPE